jgi:hypothetical protein
MGSVRLLLKTYSIGRRLAEGRQGKEIFLSFLLFFFPEEAGEAAVWRGFLLAEFASGISNKEGSLLEGVMVNVHGVVG